MTRTFITTIALVSLTAIFSAHTRGGEFRIDLSDNSGAAASWDVFTANGGPTLITDWSAGGDNDVTLTITSNTAGIAENAVGTPGATVIDGVAVPAAANNDYMWSGGAAGTSALFEFMNLDPGLYNLSVFEGRTNDGNGQFGTFWAGALGDEPGGTNTGDYAGDFATLTDISIDAGDSLFFRHSEDFTGGTSGLIVRQTQAAVVPEPSSIAIWAIVGLGLAAFGYYRTRSKR